MGTDETAMDNRQATKRAVSREKAPNLRGASNSAVLGGHPLRGAERRTRMNATYEFSALLYRFMPNRPATTVTSAMANMAAVRSSSSWISWFRWLSSSMLM